MVQRDVTCVLVVVPVSQKELIWPSNYLFTILTLLCWCVVSCCYTYPLQCPQGAQQLLLNASPCVVAVAEDVQLNHAELTSSCCICLYLEQLSRDGNDVGCQILKTERHMYIHFKQSA